MNNYFNYNYGENLTAGLDVSLEGSDSFNKTKMITAFEEELTKMYQGVYTDLQSANDLERQQRQAEYQRYQDIADGIIFLGIQNILN